MTRGKRSFAAVATIGLLLAACGGDDAGDVAATVAPSTAGATAAAVAADGAYCGAHLALETAMNAEDPAAAEPAIAAARAAVPAGIADALETAITRGADAEGPPNPEFTAAYGELVGWVREHCGFADFTLTATEYAFGGLATEVAAGPTVVQLANTGAEFHEVAMVRKDDGVTESFDELLALPEEQFGDKVTFVGAAFAAPGETGGAVVDLAAGDYLAVCFVPVGATPDALAAGGAPDGPPHFMQGMEQEFTVG